MITDILKSLKTAISASQALSDFCTDNFNKDLTVFVGADERDLPDISNAPFVIIDRAKAKYEEKNRMRYSEYDVFFFLCVVQENVDKSGNTTTYTGIYDIENMAEIVRQEVSKIEYPVDFVSSEVPSVNESSPLRRYPAYYLFERAQVKIREDR